MKTRLFPIFAASVMAVVGLAGCKPAAKDELKSLKITNKEALTAEWVVGQDDREVEYESDPVVPATEFGNKLKLTSSDATVVYTAGSMLVAVGEGTATVELKYNNKTYDSVEIEIKDELPEPAHWTGTIADAVKDLTPSNAGSKLYDLTGYIVAFQNGKSDCGSYGNYYLADTKGETDMSKCAYIYGSNPANELPAWNGAKYESMITSSGFNTNEMTKGATINSKITLTGVGLYYNGTTQEFNAKVTACDNSEVVTTTEPEIVEKTLAEIWADTQGNGKQCFTTTVKIKEFTDNKGNAVEAAGPYGNMNVTDASGETVAFCFGATAKQDAIKWNAGAGAYSFTNPQDFKTNTATKDLKVGDELGIKTIRSDYNATKEIVAVITSVNGVEVGGGGGSTDTETIVTSPVVGTAYRFGCYQETLKKYIYFNGALDGGRMTTTTKDNAVAPKPSKSGVFGIALTTFALYPSQLVV